MKNLVLSFLAISMLVSCNRESKDEKISRQAREFTEASCPKPMDEYTMLDSLVYDTEGRIMKYHYSMSGKMDTSSVYNSEMLALFHANLLNNIKQNMGLVELKKHGVTFSYSYTSSTNSTKYMNFVFTPKDYK